MQFQFCALPIPYMEKREVVNLTEDMYWLYEINGLPQISILPLKVKAKVDAHNEMFDKKPARRRNFLYENAQLTRTGVSSTIKGARLMLNNK
ncbi:hypothetical protein E5288_WYG021888 [Bos mutus]|uniref:Uncharacterized protein n=1 Tax=Bos mutus TaxID=72004 RepID=A0A6B0S8I8_9CETA|nr:hypothetical protein [Bos mutus]